MLFASEEPARPFSLRAYEDALLCEGHSLIAGVDEVGRGALAGPLVVGAVILNLTALPEGIRDSKQLSPKKREALYNAIIATAIAYETLFIPPERIDEINIYRATQEAMTNVVSALVPPPTAVLVDAMPLPNLSIPSQSIIKGDARSVSIAAASIIAKVERDRYMVTLHERYPAYGFNANKGYGAKAHLDALFRAGPTDAHRKTFAPVSGMTTYGRNLF